MPDKKIPEMRIRIKHTELDDILRLFGKLHTGQLDDCPALFGLWDKLLALQTRYVEAVPYDQDDRTDFYPGCPRDKKD